MSISSTRAKRSCALVPQRGSAVPGSFSCPLGRDTTGAIPSRNLYGMVSVITLKGDRMASRYGSSLVIAAGCPELAADTADHFVEIASSLNQDNSKLHFLKNNLRTMMYRYGLSDATPFARKLEATYEEMLDRAGTRDDLVSVIHTYPMVPK